MSRVSIKSKDDLPAELRPLWDKMTTYGAFENQAGGMAHRPPIFKHVWSLLVDLADEAVLSKRHLELALVAVAGTVEEHRASAHRDGDVADRHVVGHGAAQHLDRRGEPQEFVDGIGNQMGVLGKQAALVGSLVKQLH